MKKRKIMNNHPLSETKLSHIFKKSSRKSNLIVTHEGTNIEYKESFGWKSLTDYMKTMASFANRDGGYIIFGIKDKPHELVGLLGDSLERFENIDNQLWSNHLREHFSPEIIWDKKTYEFEGKTYGIIYTHPSAEKPVICKKDANELRKAAIYYRYNSQNSEIDYPELKSIIDKEKNKIDLKWMTMIKQMGNSGISQTVLLDLTTGKMTTPNSTLYMDESLMNEIKFIQEGSFVDTGGTPALKVVGQVQTVVGAQRIIVEQSVNKAINADEIIVSFISQESVNNPIEFIKQICYQTTGNLPVYYYLTLLKKTADDIEEVLSDVATNTQAKKLLIRRITNKETKYKKLAAPSSRVAKKKHNYKKNLLSESQELLSEADEIKYCLEAIRGIEKKDISTHNIFLLNFMYDIYSEFFNNDNYSSIKSEFRYALCWIDEALFA